MLLSIFLALLSCYPLIYYQVSEQQHAQNFMAVADLSSFKQKFRIPVCVAFLLPTVMAICLMLQTTFMHFKNAQNVCKNV